jgi:hypothetical protein
MLAARECWVLVAGNASVCFFVQYHVFEMKCVPALHEMPRCGMMKCWTVNCNL